MEKLMTVHGMTAVLKDGTEKRMWNFTGNVDQGKRIAFKEASMKFGKTNLRGIRTHKIILDEYETLNEDDE